MLYLIRHGQTEWNKKSLIQGQRNIGLDEQGMKQAQQVAQFLKNEGIEKLYSSDLTRAYDTAAAIAAASGINDIETCERLRERSFGQLEGKPAASLRDLVPNYDTNWGSEALYNMESLEVIQDRLLKRLTEIVKESKGRKVVVVSHGAIINTFIHYVTNGEHGTGKTALQNTSITTFIYEDQKWKLQTLNNHSHLI
ncbi:histidine phosphatase family protein [Priestia flexa]|uniref:histidine phosphatase family protein n=1 Tax=Priestia flexa TaxID=86664 RepID=UPI002490B439|nr:histidine phosphatase family protein [Priestia flexa]